MYIKRVIVSATLIIILSLSIPLFSEDSNLGSFNLPRNITYEGKEIAKGTYNLYLEMAGEEAYLLIKKGDEVLCREMAIILPAQRNYTEPKIAVAILAKDDDPILRVRAFYGNNMYSAYYEYMK